MSYVITNRCIRCDRCRPECPRGAIDIDGGKYSIDLNLCDNCQGYEAPQCIVSCPVNSPVPVQAKKGRCKVDPKIATSPELFSNGKNHPFASAIVVWEACNILAQRQSLPWQADLSKRLYYQRQIKGDRGSLVFRVTDALGLETPRAIDNLDIKAACLHLLYAAYATTLEQPWEQEFVISDRQIEEYLGLDKRKDLTKATKLTLIKELAQQPCQIHVAINWFQQGKVKEFSLKNSHLWELLDIQHHFQEDDLGCKHLAGLTFRIKAGAWTQHFLNRQGCQQRQAFYQYGSLPKSLLGAVMSIWQQHEGAARMLLWNRLMNARILYFQLPPDWQQPQSKVKKKRQIANRKTKLKPPTTLAAEQIIAARKSLQLSQRDLAQLTGKSQSWIRDIENGRFRAKEDDQLLLRKALGIS
jgi:DNA-binding transcriptional regulator YiaG